MFADSVSEAKAAAVATLLAELDPNAKLLSQGQKALIGVIHHGASSRAAYDYNLLHAQGLTREQAASLEDVTFLEQPFVSLDMLALAIMYQHKVEAGEPTSDLKERFEASEKLAARFIELIVDSAKAGIDLATSVTNLIGLPKEE